MCSSGCQCVRPAAAVAAGLSLEVYIQKKEGITMSFILEGTINGMRPVSGEVEEAAEAEEDRETAAASEE